MGALWTWLALLAIETSAEVTDVQYYLMPQLFELDNFEECFANGSGVFCVGTFNLQPYENQELMDIIHHFSADRCNYNHTHVHRGYCVSSRCPGAQDSALRSRFESCVDNVTRLHYNLRSTLDHFQYCRTADQKSWRPIDNLDIAFLVLFVLLVLMNVVGTAYDMFKGSITIKGNKYLLAWSLKANWARLSVDNKDGDPRLTALKPAHGVKAISLIFVILAHSFMMYHLAYTSNPKALEETCRNPLATILQNGSGIVQTFIMCSSFFLAHKLLSWTEKNPKNKLDFSLLPKCILHRVCRILPAYIVVLGLTMTWWSLAWDGPLWAPVAGTEWRRCREKWWTHLLFINNLVRPEVACLTHTWFLAVDTQLYVVASVLVLTLGNNLRRGMKVLAGLFVIAILANFPIAYFFELGSMMSIMIPKCIHIIFTNVRSFAWLYQSPWNNWPPSLIGVFTAFLHYHLQREGQSPKDWLWFCVLYRASVPGMIAWVYLGHVAKGSAPVAAAAFASVDRTVFTVLVAIALLGFFNRVDRVWWRFLSWRGWAALDRMSLSVYLLHWLLALAPLAARTAAAPATLDEIGGHFLCTLMLSYAAAVPLYLAVEQPFINMARI